MCLLGERFVGGVTGDGLERECLTSPHAENYRWCIGEVWGVRTSRTNRYIERYLNCKDKIIQNMLDNSQGGPTPRVGCM